MRNVECRHVRAASAPPRARARARAGGGSAQHHPAPARAREPRHDVDLPARNRHWGDHRDRPRAAGADDAGQRWAAVLNSLPPEERERRRRSRSGLCEQERGGHPGDDRRSFLAQTRDSSAGTPPFTRKEHSHPERSSLSLLVPSGRVVTAGRDARFARTARYRVEGDGGGALSVPVGSRHRHRGTLLEMNDLPLTGWLQWPHPHIPRCGLRSS